MTAGWQPDAGDLVWTDRHYGNGKDGAGRRPALVVSGKAFAANTGLALVCPIVSSGPSLPTSIRLPAGLPVSGEILISHIRGIDLAARPVSYAGASIGMALAEEVRARLAAVITI